MPDSCVIASAAAGEHDAIVVRRVDGRFQRLGRYTVWPLLIGYFATVWLSWDGRQAVLFDLPGRKFYVFGITFWPQDFWLLGWALIVAAFALFTFTTIVGRLWCGYSCPQTVWTGMFVAIEELTEGARHRRIRLNKAPLSAGKLARRSAKHLLWLLVALATGVTFVGYFTPIPQLVVDLAGFHASSWAVFWVLFFTAATYANAGWLREKVCLHMCPYARFQSAMIDRDTLIVSYDPARGEPRGARKASSPASLPERKVGDCVDCSLCVQVCPTGIDIRDGLQYECIGCARCIDACDGVMERLELPRGLIRYTTQTALAGGLTRWLKPRAVGYATALLVMAAALVSALILRTPFELNVQRPRASLYREIGADVENSYRLTLLNKAQAPLALELRVDSDFPVQAVGTTNWVLAPGEIIDAPLRLLGRAPLPLDSVSLQLCDRDSTRCVSERTPFIGPAT